MSKLNDYERYIIENHATNVANVVINQKLEPLEEKLKKAGLERIAESLRYLTNENINIYYELVYQKEKKKLIEERDS